MGNSSFVVQQVYRTTGGQEVRLSEIHDGYMIGCIVKSNLDTYYAKVGDELSWYVGGNYYSTMNHPLDITELAYVDYGLEVDG